MTFWMNKCVRLLCFEWLLLVTGLQNNPTIITSLITPDPRSMNLVDTTLQQSEDEAVCEVPPEIPFATSSYTQRKNEFLYSCDSGFRASLDPITSYVGSSSSSSSFIDTTSLTLKEYQKLTVAQNTGVYAEARTNGLTDDEIFEMVLHRAPVLTTEVVDDDSKFIVTCHLSNSTYSGIKNCVPRTCSQVPKVMSANLTTVLVPEISRNFQVLASSLPASEVDFNGTFVFLSVAVYQCLKGHSADGLVKGPKQVSMFCSEAGMFLPAVEGLTDCKPIQCEIPRLDFASRILPSNPDTFTHLIALEDDQGMKRVPQITTVSSPSDLVRQIFASTALPNPLGDTTVSGYGGVYSYSNSAAVIDPTKPFAGISEADAHKNLPLGSVIAFTCSESGNFLCVIGNASTPADCELTKANSFSLTCGHESDWIPQVRCEPSQCQVPQYPNAVMITEYTATQFDRKTSLIFECDDGYAVGGDYREKSFTVDCGVDADFEATLIIPEKLCEPIICMDLPRIAVMKNIESLIGYSGDEKRFNVSAPEVRAWQDDNVETGDVALLKFLTVFSELQFECLDGFGIAPTSTSPQGSKFFSATCAMSDGSWSIDNSMCVPVVCPAISDELMMNTQLTNPTPANYQNFFGATEHLSIPCSSGAKASKGEEIDAMLAVVEQAEAIVSQAKLNSGTYTVAQAMTDAVKLISDQTMFLKDETKAGCGPDSSFQPLETTGMCSIPCPSLTSQIATLAGTNTTLQEATLSDTLWGIADGPAGTVTCVEGYTVDGTEPGERISSQSLSCGRDGVWENLKLCEMVMCPIPDVTITNAKRFDTVTAPVLWRTFVQYECLTGYNLPSVSSSFIEQSTSHRSTSITMFSLMCGSEGEYTEAPVCERITCTDPPSVDNADLQSSSYNTFVFEDVAKYTCKDGYTPSQSIEATCASDGLWEVTGTCLSVSDEYEEGVEAMQSRAASAFSGEVRVSKNYLLLVVFILTLLSTYRSN